MDQGPRQTAATQGIANGWHIGVAKWFFVLGVFCAQVPLSEAGGTNPYSLRRQPSPLGASAIATMASLWRSAPLLNGPGVPIISDALDLSAIEDMWEHWQASREALHPSQAAPRLEPGLAQWLPLWQHWQDHLPALRAAVTEEVVRMVEDCEEEVKLWFESLAAHVQRAYGGKHGKCTLKLPIIKALAAEFGWGDMSLFQEMHDGFPLLGDIRPGLGWRLRNDSRYAEPKDIHVFLRENMNDFVQQKLRRGKVDECWQAMADEIAADVAMGRMEGPFEAPSWWCKRTVPLASHSRTAKLHPAPEGWFACSFAFAVHQVGSDGKDKIRRAEDWRSSGANDTVGVPDTPAYHGIDAFVNLARAVKSSAHPRHGFGCGGWTMKRRIVNYLSRIRTTLSLCCIRRRDPHCGNTTCFCSAARLAYGDIAESQT